MYTIHFRKATERFLPSLDVTQNVNKVNHTINNGMISVVFTRPCTTGDTNQDIDISESECPFFIFAWGGGVNSTTGAISYHAHRYNPGYKGTSITILFYSQQLSDVNYCTEASAFMSVIL